MEGRSLEYLIDTSVMLIQNKNCPFQSEYIIHKHMSRYPLIS